MMSKGNLYLKIYKKQASFPTRKYCADTHTKLLSFLVTVLFLVSEYLLQNLLVSLIRFFKKCIPSLTFNMSMTRSGYCEALVGS